MDFMFEFMLWILCNCIHISVHGLQHEHRAVEAPGQEITSDPGIHHSVALSKLKNSITGHREALATISFQNSNPHFKIDALNIYADGRGRLDEPCKNNSTLEEASNQAHSHQLLQQINEITKMQESLEKRLADLEIRVCKNGFECAIGLFQNIPTEIAKSPYSNKLYIFPKNEKLNFQESKTFCEQRNATLASIHSKGEYDFVEEWLSTHYKVYSHFWLGHQRPGSTAISGSSSNSWHDGTTIDYAAWGPVDNGGKPNSSGCMFMCHYCGGHINGWYIRPCTDRWQFLCQNIL